jgi:hypothetical protein
VGWRLRDYTQKIPGELVENYRLGLLLGIPSDPVPLPLGSMRNSRLDGGALERIELSENLQNMIARKVPIVPIFAFALPDAVFEPDSILSVP